MRKINYFLASSINEFKEERNKLGSFVLKITPILLEHDIYINLLECEFDSGEIELSKRKQEAYNEFIRTCDICTMLVGSFVGEYTMEEYRVSLETYEKRNDFFFDVEISNITDNEARINFVNQAKEDKILLKVFNNIHDLYFTFLMNLRLFGIEVECKNSKIYLYDEEILDCDDVSVLKNYNNFDAVNLINSNFLKKQNYLENQENYYELYIPKVKITNHLFVNKDEAIECISKLLDGIDNLDGKAKSKTYIDIVNNIIIYELPLEPIYKCYEYFKNNVDIKAITHIHNSLNNLFLTDVFEVDDAYKAEVVKLEGMFLSLTNLKEEAKENYKESLKIYQRINENNKYDKIIKELEGYLND